MGYVTQETLEHRFGTDELLALADRNRDGTIDPAVVAQAITDASGEIDSYLGTRYAVPLSVVPDSIKSAAADIARYRMMDDRPLEEASKRYDAAIRFLRDVATGRAALGIEQGQQAEAAPFRYAATRDSNSRAMSKETLEGY